MTNSKIRAPFAWFGGKGSPKIKSALLAALPPHRFYVEPFGGGASPREFSSAPYSGR